MASNSIYAQSANYEWHHLESTYQKVDPSTFSQFDIKFDLPMELVPGVEGIVTIEAAAIHTGVEGVNINIAINSLTVANCDDTTTSPCAHIVDDLLRIHLGSTRLTGPQRYDVLIPPDMFQELGSMMKYDGAPADIGRRRADYTERRRRIQTSGSSADSPERDWCMKKYGEVATAGNPGFRDFNEGLYRIFTKV